MTSRDKILQNISRSLAQNPFVVPGEPDWLIPDLHPLQESLVDAFIAEIHKVSGQAYRFNSIGQAVNFMREIISEIPLPKIVCTIPQLNSEFEKAPFALYDGSVDVGVTRCEYLIARTGTVCVSSNVGRAIGVMPSTLFVVAGENQIVPTLSDAISALKAKYNNMPAQVSFLTGPSRTADIEKTLVMGAHGAEKLIVILLPENSF